MNRRWCIFAALLATMLLFYCVPGLLGRHLGNTGRTDDRLKPAQSRTMVVWVTSWLEEDRKLIAGLCTAFEKQRPGLRIYLRRTDPQELAMKDAVLPDAVLHTTGDILSPSDGLIPLETTGKQHQQPDASGSWQGRQYAVALWYSPLVFSVPVAWFSENMQPDEGTPPAGQSYLAPSPAVPQAREQTFTMDDVPWGKILDTGQIVSENGVGLALLTTKVPYSLREEWHRLEPVLRKPADDEAAVCSLAVHRGRSDGTELFSLPSAAQQARYVSLCRSTADSEAFLLFLQSDEAQKAAMECCLTPIAAHEQPENGDSLFLPNAFAMDETTIDQLCIQGFSAGEDPVATLLKLR